MRSVRPDSWQAYHPLGQTNPIGFPWQVVRISFAAHLNPAWCGMPTMGPFGEICKSICHVNIFVSIRLPVWNDDFSQAVSPIGGLWSSPTGILYNIIISVDGAASKLRVGLPVQLIYKGPRVSTVSFAWRSQHISFLNSIVTRTWDDIRDDCRRVQGIPRTIGSPSDHHGDWGPFRPSNSWPELLGWSMWTMPRQRRTRWIKWYQTGMAVLRCSKYDDQCIEPVLRLFWYWINSILILYIYLLFNIYIYLYYSMLWVREA